MWGVCAVFCDFRDRYFVDVGGVGLVQFWILDFGLISERNHRGTENTEVREKERFR